MSNAEQEFDAVIAPRRARYAGFNEWWESLDESIRERARVLQRGGIDFHVHCDPSPAMRSLDAIEAAEEASAAGMRAIVIKDHHSHTEESAWLAQHHAKIDGDFEIFGSTWLNNYTGGWNVFAVDKAIIFGSRLICAPTVAAVGQFERKGNKVGGKHAADVAVTSRRPPRRAEVIYTIDDNGHVLTEVMECLKLIAEAGDVVLGTGHLNKDEVWAVVRAGKECGIERFCLTHAPSYTGATAEELHDLATETGAVSEFIASYLLENVDTFAETFRTIGLENVTFSTDAGFFLTPKPVLFHQYGIAAMLVAGMSDTEILEVTTVTPSRLLGIDVPAGVLSAS